MMSLIRSGGLCLICVLGGLLLAQPLTAQDPDLLKNTQDRLRIEADRLEAVVREAIQRADQVGRTQPQMAVTILRQAVGEIEADKDALKQERRDQLARKLKLAMNAYSDRADNVPTRTVIEPVRRAPQEKRPDDIAKQLQDYAKPRQDSGKSDLQKVGDLKAERSKNEAAIARQFAAMFPAPGDVTYPKDWLTRVAKRTTGIKLTEKEKEIVKSLNAKMTIELEGKTFQNVVDYLTEKTKLPIVVDGRALGDLNITYDAPVNVKLKGVSTRTVLKRFLADLGLTYVMKDETILVTTPARAKEMLTTRTYSIIDLIPTGQGMAAFGAQIQAIQTAQMLMVTITQTVEPDSWEVNGKGGAGQIYFYPPTFSIVVKQTAEMHYLMGLSGGR